VSYENVNWYRTDWASIRGVAPLRYHREGGALMPSRLRHIGGI